VTADRDGNPDISVSRLSSRGHTDRSEFAGPSPVSILQAGVADPQKLADTVEMFDNRVW
jgi:hypothetical protein